jgi:hypothetical protein
MTAVHRRKSEFFEEVLAATVPQIVALAAAIGHRDIDRMLRTHARRFQVGADYGPEQHALAVLGGWKGALRSGPMEGAVGNAEHNRFGVTGRPDLIYLVGATLTVLSVQYVTVRIDKPIAREEFSAFEDAFEAMLLKYGAGDKLAKGHAWPSHVATVKRTLNTMQLRDGTAKDLWDITDALGIDQATRETILDAMKELLPTHLHQAFQAEYLTRY